MTARRKCCRCGCGAPVERPARLTGRPQEYASPACRKRAHRARRRQSVHFRSRSDEWATPPDLVADLAAEFAGGAFDLDPCCGGASTACAPRFYTSRDDGLALPWHGRVFMNPPYGRVIGRWMSRAAEAARAGEVDLVVCLVPARPGTRWYIAARAAADELGGEVRELPGRVRFRPFGANPAVAEYLARRAQGRQLQGAAFPSAVFVFAGRKRDERGSE